MAKAAKERDGIHVIHCPGCECLHIFDHRWSFDGDLERPSFRPSYLVHGVENQPNYKSPRCHSYVTNGKIQFLADSTHKLKGQTVDLPELDEDRSLWPWTRKLEDE